MIGQLFGIIKANEKLHVLWCAMGIILSLVVYGWLQERVMQWPYGTGAGEHFTYTLFIVLCNRLTSNIVAAGSIVVSGESLAPAAPVYKYALVSISNVVATSCQYEALKHISFPLQTLGKCAKMIPVMIWGTFIMRKKYKFIDYLVAVVVMLGCTVFFLMGETAAKNIKEEVAFQETLYGLMLMVGYLGFDGFTSTFQDKLFRGYNMSTYNQITYITLCSSFFSICGLITAGQLGPALLFVGRHPDSLQNILTLSAAATVSQLFISHTIKTFGALLFATVMTTRQVISIVLSCIIFVHPLTLGQWMGIIAVFGSLYLKSYYKDQEKKIVRASAPPPEKVTVEFRNNPLEDNQDLEKQSLIGGR